MYIHQDICMIHQVQTMQQIIDTELNNYAKFALELEPGL